MVDEALVDVVQSISEQAYRPPLVLQHPDGPNVFVDVNTYDIAPCVGEDDDGEEICQPVKVSDMGCLDVKATRLQGLEAGLYLPSLLVHPEGLLGIAEGHQDLKFRHFLIILDLGVGEVAWLTVDIVNATLVSALAEPQVIEEPPGFERLPVPADHEVLPDPDMIMYVVCIKIIKPLASHELAVCHQMPDAVLAGDCPEAGNEFDSLSGVGVVPLVKHLEQYRKRHAFIDDRKGQDIDVRGGVLPVRPVHG